MTQLQSYRVTELQSYRVTELQSYKVTELQSCKVTEVQSNRGTLYNENLALKFCVPKFGIGWRRSLEYDILFLKTNVTNMQISPYPDFQK